jgi:hypothetical protein
MRCLAIVALAGLCPLLAASEASAHKAAAPAQVKAVYELYTSQGCSSCPAADAVFARIVKRDDVIALTLPVDIWDYLGWRDTLARPEFSDRLRAYAKVLGDGMVYTPQAVVSGLTQANASSEDKIERAIANTAEPFAASRVPVKLSAKNGRLLIDVAAAPDGVQAKEATVWLAAIATKVEVPITRGENQGRTVTYYNVVRRLIPIGTWNGTKMTVELHRHSFMAGDADRCAVLLQQGQGGPIVGASLIDGV